MTERCENCGRASGMFGLCSWCSRLEAIEEIVNDLREQAVNAKLEVVMVALLNAADHYEKWITG